MHVSPRYKSGTINSRAGVFMAGTASFDVKVNGAGGHAAMPHLSHDSVVATSAIITSLQVCLSLSAPEPPFTSILAMVVIFKSPCPLQC